MPAPSHPHATEDQSEVLSFLATPIAHGVDVERVERIDTHGSIVFLAGTRAIKVKRAVRYPYMDYATAALRRAACEREVALNRRIAPELYLGVEAIRRGADGSLSFGGIGEPIEWAVVMRRVPAEDFLDRRAALGGLDESLVRAAARAIADHHASAEVIDDRASHGGGMAGLQWVIRDNTAGLREHPTLFAADVVADLEAASLAALGEVGERLDRRLAAGRVRRCHGDLHLGNLCLWNNRATLFDAIEFNDRLSCVDVLYDLAFFLMELDRRVGRSAANLALNHYLRCGLYAPDGEVEALAALPLFLSVRATVRAKVSAAAITAQAEPARRARLEQAARAYFRAARDYLQASGPRLVAVGGRSGSGKSTVAKSLAPRLGRAPGALHLRSDVLRKLLHRVEDETRLPESAYAPEISERVYRLMEEIGLRALRAGQAVIVDAVFDRSDSRAAIAAVAEKAAVPFEGVWLEASPEVMRARLAARRHDASDATQAVLDLQLTHDIGKMEWRVVSAEGAPESVAGLAAEVLSLPSAPPGPDPDLRL